MVSRDRKWSHSSKDLDDVQTEMTQDTAARTHGALTVFGLCVTMVYLFIM